MRVPLLSVAVLVWIAACSSTDFRSVEGSRRPSEADGAIAAADGDDDGTTEIPEAPQPDPTEASAPEAGTPGPYSAACAKTTMPKSAVLRVEIDTEPAAPVKDGTHVTAYFTVVGNNSLDAPQLDFCTKDGAVTNAGGGLDFLGGGGDVSRRWRTKEAVKLPLGVVQAQVVANDSGGAPELKRADELTLQ